MLTCSEATVCQICRPQAEGSREAQKTVFMKKHLKGPQRSLFLSTDIVSLCPQCQEQLQNTADTQHMLLLWQSLCSKFLQNPRTKADTLRGRCGWDGAGKVISQVRADSTQPHTDLL